MSRRLRVLLAGALVTVMMLAVAGVAWAAPAQPVTQFKSDGTEAAMFFDTGLEAGFVFVSRFVAEDGSVDETYLNYLVVDRLTGQFREDGAGVIPNSSFTVTDEGSQLLVDTRTLPDFAYYTGTGGLLDIEWIKDGNVKHRDTDTWVVQEGPNKIITNGTRTVETAPAQGMLFDFTVSRGEVDEAFVGSNRSTTITIER